MELAAIWTPAPLAGLLGPAMELAAWEGRELVFQDGETDAPAFAFDAVRQAFKPQIEFLRQKRVRPTKWWTDALGGDHDRAFVIAGATDTAMLEEFQASIIKAAEEGSYVEDFAKDFDRIVEKYGWEYRGERNWRIRTIFETNIRTSFMAGRLRQMRDPDVVKLRPYWQYLHGDSRTPLVPRKQHLAWHNLVLMWDDPWWEVHFPPNDWRCSCGVRTLSRRDLERQGKSGPDEAPKDALLPVIDKASGQMVMQPMGIGLGWDHMPGDLWSRGLVPSALNPDLDRPGRHLVSIDEAAPMEELWASSQPFRQKVMQPDLPDANYIDAFLKVFSDQPGFTTPFFVDRSGHKLVIDDALFRDRSGELKLHVGDRAPLIRLIAEAIIDPDEIWLGVRRNPLIVEGVDFDDLIMTRRYIRTDGSTGIFAAFDLGRRHWEGVTGYRPAKSYPTDKPVKTNWSYLKHERTGKLLWKRKG